MRRLCSAIVLGLCCAPAVPRENKTDLHGDPLPAGVATRLGTIRLRHAGPSNVIAWSPDGKLLAAADAAGPTQLWDLSTGKLLRQFGQGRSVSRVKLVFSPDGKLLAVGAADIKLHEIATGQERQQISPTQDVKALVFSPDGRYLVAGLNKGGMQVFEVATGMRGSQVGDPLGDVQALAISPDGATLAAAAADTAVALWAKPPWRELARSAAPLRLEPAEVEIFWKTLAQPDGRRAHQAIWALTGASAQSVPFLRDKLKPADAVTAKKVEQYLRDLDNDNFGVREKATRELELLGDQVETTLRAALADNSSLEARRRLGEILEHLEDPPPERLRLLRALEVLEHADSDDARQALAALAKGGTGHWLTDSARRARANAPRQNPALTGIKAE
ncbi:MAG TPA: hypothetical protein VGO93_00730 [Candidatus Xenobia bacterium]|jgi:hypothetical protein